MSGSDVKTFGFPGVGFLLLVNLIVASLFFSPGTGDVGVWETWMREISAYGLIGGFAHSGTDYPPLSFILLAAVSRTATALQVSQFFVLKCSLLLFLVASAACFYWFTRNLLLSAGLELTLVLNSVALGYLDIYFAPFLIAALFQLQRGNPTGGLLLFAISCFIKWQPLIIAPFICAYVLGSASERSTGKNPRLKTQVIPFAITAGAVAIPLLLIFGWKVFDSFWRAMTWHAFLSANGLNFSWLQTWLLELMNPEKYGALHNGEINIFLTRDPLLVWPDKILFYLSYAVILFAFARQRKTFERLIAYSILGYLAYFVFNTGVHENHLFLVCCLAWTFAFLEPGQLVRCINLSLAANANLFLFYGAFGGERIPRVFAGFDITVLFAITNLFLFGGFLVETLKRDGLDLWFVRLQPRQNAAG